MIHCYQLNGYNIVLDVYSGSVHVVDDLAYDVISMYEGHSADEIVAAMLEKYSGQSEGVQSYGLMVDYILAYYDAVGLLAS